MNAREILAIIEIIYFVPALCVALTLSWRHGFSKQLGWFSLVMLSLFRISAGCTTIASDIHPSRGVITASFVLQSFGLASIIIALQGFLSRLNDVIVGFQFPVRIFKLLHLLTSIAIALAIVGICYMTDSTPGNDGQGSSMRKAAVMIFVGVFCILVIISTSIVRRVSQLASEEKPLLTAVVISLPLLAIRLLFSVLAVFNVDSSIFSIFSTLTTAVIAEACMTTIEEFGIVASFFVAGFKVPILANAQLESRPAKVEEGHAHPTKSHNTQPRA